MVRKNTTIPEVLAPKETSPSGESEFSLLDDPGRPYVETVTEEEDDDDNTSIASNGSIFLDLEDTTGTPRVAEDYVELSKTHCRYIFQASDKGQKRVCGCDKYCRRQGHRNGHNTAGQAAVGIFLAMPRTRANQVSVDGLLSGRVTENEYAALQEQSYVANQQDAVKLTQGSPHVTIGYASTTSPVNWRMNDAETPLRHNRSPDDTGPTDSKSTFTKPVALDKLLGPTEFPTDTKPPRTVPAPGPPNTTQEGEAVRQMEARMTTKFETQMNTMMAYNEKMYSVMQDHLDKAAQKIQENLASARSEPAPPGRRPARYHAVNRGPGMGVYRSSKKAKRAAKRQTRTPPAEIRQFPTEDEAWEWIDETSGSASSSGEETDNTRGSDGGNRPPRRETDGN
jgi:hypothetical protein